MKMRQVSKRLLEEQHVHQKEVQGIRRAAEAERLEVREAGERRWRETLERDAGGISNIVCYSLFLIRSARLGRRN